MTFTNKQYPKADPMCMRPNRAYKAGRRDIKKPAKGA